MAVLRDGDCPQIDLVAEQFHFLDRTVADHHRPSAPGGHSLGEVGADLPGVIEPERSRLPRAVHDQHVGEPPAGIARQTVKHQRALALGAQVADLGDGIDLLMDVQHAVVDGFEKTAQCVRHVRRSRCHAREWPSSARRNRPDDALDLKIVRGGHINVLRPNRERTDRWRRPRPGRPDIHPASGGNSTGKTR